MRAAALLAVALAISPACARPPGPAAPPLTSEVNRKYEVQFQVPGRTRPPDEVEILAELDEPSGRVVHMRGFALEHGFAVRFRPREPGEHYYRVVANGGAGPHEVAAGRFTAVESGALGAVSIAREDPHVLSRAGGGAFRPLGENRFNVYDRSWNFLGMSVPDYLASMARHGMNTIRVFIFTACKLRPPRGHQPGCLEPDMGRFDPVVAQQFDAVFDSAERDGIEVVLTLFAVGFTPGDPWKGWEDNPYSAARGGPAARNVDFFVRPEARGLEKRRLRYALARWGYSTSLLAVDLLNEPEWDGAIPESAWIPWAEDLAATWHAEDPYEHLVTLGSVGLHWNIERDERPWWSSPQDDVVEFHRYGPDVYEVHDLAAAVTGAIRDAWQYGKPVLVGEFAYGGENKVTYDHTHVGIWSATFAGAGVLAHSAPTYNMDLDEPMTPQRGRHFEVLSRFLARLGRAPLRPFQPRVSPPSLGVWGLERPGLEAIWILAPREGYGSPAAGAVIGLRDLSPGAYRITWWNDVTGEPVGSEEDRTRTSELRLAVPRFARHLAATIVPLQSSR